MERPFAFEKESRTENVYEKLTEAMSEVATEVNTELYRRWQQKALVDEQGRLVENNFTKDYQSGPYTNGEINADNKKIAEQEKSWAGSQRIEEWKKSKDRAKSNQLEMVITLLLHKALGDKYLVVRSTAYDDYFNGVDNLILDKNTGEVICAFDDFNDNSLDAERHLSKEKKMARKNAEGVKVKYGLTIKNNKIQRQAISNTPIFLLSMDSRQLDADLNDTEKQALKKLGELLEQEHQTLSAGGLFNSVDLPAKADASALGGVLKVAGELKKL